MNDAGNRAGSSHADCSGTEHWRSPRQLLMSRLFSRQVLVFWGIVRPCLFRFADKRNWIRRSLFCEHFNVSNDFAVSKILFVRTKQARCNASNVCNFGTTVLRVTRHEWVISRNIFSADFYPDILCYRPCNQHCESRTGVIRSRRMSTQVSKQSI